MKFLIHNMSCYQSYLLSVMSREMLRQNIKQIAEAMHKDVGPSQGQDHTCRDFVWVLPRAHLGVVATCGRRYFACIVVHLRR